MNNLYNILGGQSQMQNLMNQFNQFRQSFSGDPKQQVQNMLNSGQMSQAQFNRLAQMANQIRGMMK